MEKHCIKCGRLLPANHKKKYCVGPRHDCDCNNELNKWREETKKSIREILHTIKPADLEEGCKKQEELLSRLFN